jgi:hypothetical protein
VSGYECATVWVFNAEEEMVHVEKEGEGVAFGLSRCSSGGREVDVGRWTVAETHEV